MPGLRHRGQRRFHRYRHGPRHLFTHFRGTTHSHRRRVAPPVRRRTSRRPYLLLAGGVAVVVVIAVAVLGWLAVRSLERARTELDAARSAADGVVANPHVLLSAPGRTQAARALQQVRVDAAAARQTLGHSVGLSVLGVLPVVSTQRDGLLTLIDDLQTTAGTGSQLLQRVDALLAASHGTTVALPQLRALQQSVATAYRTLKPLDRPTGGLLGPLASARQTFDRADAKTTALLRQGEQVLDYALPFLGADGPRTYLVAGENNAEMRDQGSVLSLAVMHAQGGTFSVGTTGSVGTFTLHTPADVTVPSGTAKVFGALKPTQIWQNVDATADFPFSGQAMQAMFAQANDQHVDGVIAIDVPALASLLTLTGPVSVPGITEPVTSANVSEILLHQLYEGYPSGSQTERHDDISAVAKAVVDQMQHEHVDLAVLANTLARDVAGRHLMVWDENPTYEATLRAAGASGAIDTVDPRRTFHLAVESATAAKLDYYVDVKVRMDVTITEANEAQVDTYVTVVNHAPAGQPPSYQLGPDGVSSSVPGQYVSRIYLWSPRGSLTGSGTPESGLVLNQTATSVLPQQQQTVLFETVIPHAVRNGKLTLHLVPQSLLRPAALTVQVAAGPNWSVHGPTTETDTLQRPLTLSWRVTPAGG